MVLFLQSNFNFSILLVKRYFYVVRDAISDVSLSFRSTFTVVLNNMWSVIGSERQLSLPRVGTASYRGTDGEKGLT